MQITEQQVQQYRDEGFLVVPDLLNDEEIERFLEHEKLPKAPEMQQGLVTYRVDSEWRRLATNPRTTAIVSQLMEGRPRIVQTMFLNKRAAGGKGIALHQDAHYIRNEPNTLMACWLALADTDGANGGLCVVKGSHSEGLVSARRNADTKEHDTWVAEHTLRDREGREWQEPIHAARIEVPEEQIARLTVPRGGGVFFGSLTIHGSFANHSSDRPRPAFATHYVREDTWVFRTDIQELGEVPGEA